MIGDVILRRATSADIALVAEMWNRSAAWLAERGYDQWQYPVKMHNIERTVSNGDVWLAELDDGRTAGMISVDTDAEPTYWAGDEPENALYVHRMVTERWASGSDLGGALLDWAGRRAQSLGKKWLRLDAWKTNPDLHRYYETRGFEFVRTAGDESDPSGVCYQRDAEIQLEAGPRVIGAEF